MTPADPSACAGHRCDDCQTCRRGRCCRRDNPDYRLPRLGAWDGPIYGELGRLEDLDDTVTCHACGGAYRHLGSHAWATHDLTGAEYRAIFGLGRQRPLAASALRASCRARTTKAIAEGRLRIDYDRLAAHGFQTSEQAAQASEISHAGDRPEVVASQRRRGTALGKATVDQGRGFVSGPRSDELKRNLSAALSGKAKSDEHRRKIAESVRAAHARRRAQQEAPHAAE